MKDIEPAGPGDGVNLIAAPQPDSGGTAKLSYPIDVPLGRNGMQPQLAVQYDSGNGDGWMAWAGIWRFRPSWWTPGGVCRVTTPAWRPRRT
jgi:hypothetical protein